MNLLPLLLVFGVAGDDFNQDIRPLLADRCFTCHGPDAGQRQADLRLDLRDAALKKLESGSTAIVPGKPEMSELVRRIQSTDPDVMMPPPDSGKSLTKQEKQTLIRWIQGGAAFDQHWSFRAPRRPALPTVKRSGWAKEAVDHFVLAKLEEKGMKPSGRADRITLARRLSLDLRGLPPSMDELERFLADKSPSAWEKYVDAMLASRHYGERMAQDWLDLARYGDTNGFHADSDRTMWLYRDYVINSFNSNKPYNEFIVENLAGDLLPKPSDQARIASGFNRCNTFNEEGGADPAEFFVAYAVDRTNTFGQVFLGLTIGCAQCHDHKYDPISQRDYYQLFAFFNSIEGEVGAGGPSGYHGKELPPLLSVPSDNQRMTLATLPKRRASLQKKIDETLRSFEKADQDRDLKLTAWAKDLAAGKTTRPELPEVELWLDAADLNGNGKRDSLEGNSAPEKVKVWHDRSGKKRNAEAISAPDYVAKALGGFPAVRFDGMGHHMRTKAGGLSLKRHFTIAAVFRSTKEKNNQMLVMWGEESTGRRRSLWRHADGRFSFNGYARDVVGNKPLAREPHLGIIMYNADSGKVRLYLDGAKAGEGAPGLVDYMNDRITIGCNNGNGEFAAAEYSEVILLSRELGEQEHQQLGKHLAAKYGLSTKYGGAPQEIQAIAEKAAEKRSEEEFKKLRRYFARHIHNPTKMQIAGLESELGKITGEEKRVQASVPTTLVMVQKKMRTPAYILMRGDFQQKGDEVQPDVPTIFPRLPEGAPRNRLGLARWLTSPDNPLVARVVVNRLWKQVFGTGLVKTLGDFGTQGELPSHPQLLDWLAVELVQSGWDIKALQKKLVMSETYRQSSHQSHEYDEVDPYNRLFSRAPRYRLSAEQIRDVALAVSGLLERQVGGPSVKPYQPQGYYRDKVGRDWKQAKGADLYRRGLYTYWRRTTLYPAFQIFDAPSREVCTVNRPRTNTPLQALVLMNDPGYVEAARAFAQHLLTMEKGMAEDARLRYAFRRTVSRQPTGTELNVLKQIIAEQRAVFTQDKKAADQLVAVGEITRPSGLDNGELAAWTALASVLLNLDETITRE